MSKVEITEQTVKDAVRATMQGMLDWIEQDTIIVDKATKVELKDAEIEIKEDELGKPLRILKYFINPELEKYGITYLDLE